MDRNLRKSLLPGLAMASILLGARAAHAEVISNGARELFDLTPERIERFRQALRDFSRPAGADPSIGEYGIVLESEYYAPPEVLDDPALAVPTGVRGDAAANEALFIEGREDDYESAARTWVERRLKGSEITPGPRPPGLRTELAWNDGPLIGCGAGPVVVQAGESSWRIKVGHVVRTPNGPWMVRGWVGEKDGDNAVGFTIGRNLLASRVP